MSFRSMTHIDRRTFLTAAMGVADAARFGRRIDAAQQATPVGNPRRIDVHHHFAPPAWIADVKGRPLLQPANTRWTPEQSIEDMDRGGVAAAVVSITNPGLWFGDPAQSRRLARACNEYGARLVSDHPARFGLFAAVPLPDVDATLGEIAHAYDSLKADGMTRDCSVRAIFAASIVETRQGCCRGSPGSFQFPDSGL
jgi:6-methylsalicylate decarboxylase